MTDRIMAEIARDVPRARPPAAAKNGVSDALRAAATRLGVPARDLVVVGDDPLLEVPMAHRGHALAVAVQTGLAGPDAYDHLPPAKRPHLHLRGVDELLSLLQTTIGAT